MEKSQSQKNTKNENSTEFNNNHTEDKQSSPHTSMDVNSVVLNRLFDIYDDKTPMGSYESSKSTNRDRDEFCFDEDEFHEDHPFMPTRMTASCEGTFSILGCSNDHLVYEGNLNSELETCKLRSYAVSMPHLAGDCDSQNPLPFKNELRDDKESESKYMVCEEQQQKDQTELQRHNKNNLEKIDVITPESSVDCDPAIEDDCEEGEETLDLEFEYEPGISLSHMEFGRQVNAFQLLNQEECKEQKVEQQELFRRKTSEMCTSSTCSTSQRDRYKNVMMASSQMSDRSRLAASNSQQPSKSITGYAASHTSNLVTSTRCRYCGVDYESGR